MGGCRLFRKSASIGYHRGGSVGHSVRLHGLYYGVYLRRSSSQRIGGQSDGYRQCGERQTCRHLYSRTRKQGGEIRHSECQNLRTEIINKTDSMTSFQKQPLIAAVFLFVIVCLRFLILTRRNTLPASCRL